jgi:O-antigen/teichoic acid export membrane protein
MVSSLSSLEAGGIYATTIIFGTLVSIPSRTVKKITSALFADGWMTNDLKMISEVYRKSCLTQFIIGIMIFLCIWGNVHNIMKILPPEYAMGTWAIFWGCVTNLMEMLSGASGSLLGTSKHYKVQAYQAVILVVIIVGANYLFIPLFGLSGAAFATAISFFIFNVFKYLYILHRWGFQPYGKEILYVFLLGCASYGLLCLIPLLGNFIVDALTRTVIATLSFGGVVYFMKLSPEVNTAVNMVAVKIPVLNSVLKLK